MSTDILNVLDSEVLAIERVHLALQDRARSGKLNYNAFEREARDRFADIGFSIDVNWYEFSIDGVKQDGAMPEITITGRTEAKAWDPDRQVHEAVNNILELPGQEGWIKTDPETVRRFMEGQGSHSHRGHGHRH